MNATIGGVGNVSEWLVINYTWEPMKKGQNRSLIKNGVILRAIDFDEMSDWHDEPLKTYRHHFVR